MSGMQSLLGLGGRQKSFKQNMAGVPHHRRLQNVPRSTWKNLHYIEKSLHSPFLPSWRLWKMDKLRFFQQLWETVQIWNSVLWICLLEYYIRVSCLFTFKKGVVQMQIRVRHRLVVHSRHLDATRPHRYWIEVRGVNTHTSRIHSYHLT